MDHQYTVRTYRPEDREAFLTLFETVFGDHPGAEWFAWKYERNPAVDHVPIVVAETDGTLVGARSFFGLRMTTGAGVAKALQPCDTMVHPDHRRRGLFTRMTEAAIEQYRDTDVGFFFNYPNEHSLPGNLQLGWRIVTEVPTAYRIQRPGASLAGRLPAPVDSAVARGVDAMASGCYWLNRRVREKFDPRSSLSNGSATDLTIERRESVPAGEFATLARASETSTFRALRDKPFYRWRFENPRWTYTTYVARHDGSPVAGLIAGSRQTGERTTVSLTEFVPGTDLEPHVVVALLEAALADHPNAASLAAMPGQLPDPVVSAFGFLTDTARPLSQVSRPATLVARPAAGSPDGSDPSPDDWIVGGHRLDDPDNWTPALSERDWC